jgi:hypothetical protein
LVGEAVGAGVGPLVGEAVGAGVGPLVGRAVGAGVGLRLHSVAPASDSSPSRHGIQLSSNRTSGSCPFFLFPRVLAGQPRQDTCLLTALVPSEHISQEYFVPSLLRPTGQSKHPFEPLLYCPGMQFALKRRSAMDL